MAETTGLLNRRTGQPVPRVRISFSPPSHTEEKYKTLQIRDLRGFIHKTHEHNSNLYLDAISANVLRIRRDRESDGMERNARPHPEQIPLPEPSSVTRPVCDRPENSCGIPIIDIRSIHSSPYKAYFAKKQSVHPVFISYIYK